MSPRPELVFIVAPTGKCGTNYLIHALVRLGVARFPEGDALSREDYLFQHAHLLEDYVRHTVGEWCRWDAYSTADSDDDRLLRTLGDGLVEFDVSPRNDDRLELQ